MLISSDIGLSLKNDEIWSVGKWELKKSRKSRQSGCQESNFEPYYPTILTKCAPFSSRALNFRYSIHGQIGGT